MEERNPVLPLQRLEFLAWEQTQAGRDAKQALAVLALRAKAGIEKGVIVEFGHAASARAPLDF